jgi:hypothetical protein
MRVGRMITAGSMALGAYRLYKNHQASQTPGGKRRAGTGGTRGRGVMSSGLGGLFNRR